MKPIRIAVVTIGRFHLLDLARELSTLGYEVQFWSLLPFYRVKNFGLPKKVYRSVLGLAVILLR